MKIFMPSTPVSKPTSPEKSQHCIFSMTEEWIFCHHPPISIPEVQIPRIYLLHRILQLRIESVCYDHRSILFELIE